MSSRYRTVQDNFLECVDALSDPYVPWSYVAGGGLLGLVLGGLLGGWLLWKVMEPALDFGEAGRTKAMEQPPMPGDLLASPANTARSPHTVTLDIEDQGRRLRIHVGGQGLAQATTPAATVLTVTSR